MEQENGKIVLPVQAYAVELRELCIRYGVSRLEIFGSAATGQFRDEDSDLDFLVEFLPLAVVNYADNYFGLLEGLEALFSRPVDLVVELSIRNPYFRQSVEESKSLIYAA